MTEAGVTDPGSTRTVDTARRAGEGRNRVPTPPRLIAVVAGVNVLSLIVSLAVARQHVHDFWLGVALLSTLAALAGAGPVRIPSFKTSISVTDAFVFAALGGYGALPAVLVAGAGVIGSVFGRQPERRALRMAFNVGNMTLSAAVGAVVYLVAGGVPGGPAAAQVLPMFLAGLIYLTLNTGLVALVVVLATDRPFLATWAESARWAAVSASIGLTLAVGLLWAISLVGTSGLALGIPPCWMLASFYRTHKERQETQAERLNRMQGLNEFLEEKVNERTVELQRALSHIESANERLTQANERLTEANRAKSEFLAKVSHELRTPLNAIIGFSELLSERGADPLTEQQSEFISDIHESGEHLLNLINSILDVSKIEAGKMEVRPVCFSVAKALRESVAMLRPQAVARELDLGSECAADVLYSELDPGMFRQLLVNLLGNAVKFTEAGGRVVARARREDDTLVLEVEDTGIGMAPEHLDRIFDEFYQVDGSYARNYEGTGLGLALVQRMVRLQGGSIDVRSTVGEGSTFFCRFPGVLREGPPAETTPTEPEMELAIPRDPRNPAASAEPLESRPRERSDGRTVLVVEDNPMNRKLARNALRSQGYTVVEATSGEEALRLLQVRAVDVVLMDLQLPGMDGLEATRRLKADEATAAFPVVALTANSSKEDERAAADAGCCGFIVKPIRLAQFPRQVAEFIAGANTLSG